MKNKELTYSKAKDELQNILNRLEKNEIEIDDFPTILNRANELVNFCESKLMDIEKLYVESTD